MRKRRTHSPEFKDRIAIEAISGRMTIQEFAADHAIHRIQVSTTVTRRPGNSYLAAFRASALSAAKSGVTAMPSGR